MDQSLVHPNRVRQPNTVSFRLPPSQLCRHYTQHVGRALCLEQTRLTRCKLKNSTESTTNVDCQFGSRSLQTLWRNNNCLHVAKIIYYRGAIGCPSGMILPKQTHGPHAGGCKKLREAADPGAPPPGCFTTKYFQNIFIFQNFEFHHFKLFQK